MLKERGVNVELYMWVQKYAPEMEKHLRWYWKPGWASSWQVEETYIRVKRALDVSLPNYHGFR